MLVMHHGGGDEVVSGAVSSALGWAPVPPTVKSGPSAGAAFVGAALREELVAGRDGEAVSRSIIRSR